MTSREESLHEKQLVAKDGDCSGGGRLRLAVHVHKKETKAAPRLGFGQPACVTYIPREWGEYKGGSQQSGLAFRDNAGTLRFFTNIPCGNPPQVALEIRRSNGTN
jgi:hypothetical protein